MTIDEIVQDPFRRKTIPNIYSIKEENDTTCTVASL